MRRWAPALAVLIGGATALGLEPVVGPWVAGALLLLEAFAARRLLHVDPQQRARSRLDRARDQLESQLGDTTPSFEDALAQLLDRYDQAQRRLQRNLDLRDAIFEYAPGGVVFTGAGGWVKAVNKGMRALMPVVPKPVGKRMRSAIVHPELADTMERAIAAGEPVLAECTAGRFDVLIRAAPVGEAGACIAVVVDVSPLKRAAQARSDFVANVSHELRTPITSIRGYAETLLDMPGSLDEEHVLMLGAIDRNARRLTTIFEDLLSLACIEAREGELELETQALAPLLTEVAASFEHSARARRVDVVVVCDEALSARVYPQAFDRILGNLVANAVKFSPEKSAVRLTARADGEQVLVEVHDSGPGIAPKYHERVFERFFRLDKGRARTHGGSGLGLSLVKHLCHATGASVGVRSNPGHGAVFWVRFPGPSSADRPSRERG